ncbi:MAG: hypothetical protein ISN28_00560 [Ectothiorhodospiraceae bacterium AqS1]|nr:hypothetical protein [Ectothiorhodospiraceae bacterium AqS1]
MAERKSIEAIARRAEDWGFSWLSVSDHLIVPRSIASRYPYCASGTYPEAAGGNCLEQFTLAFLPCGDHEPSQIIEFGDRRPPPRGDRHCPPPK